MKLDFLIIAEIRLRVFDMAIKNGKWNVITMKLCPGSMGVRHFVPFVFLLSVIITSYPIVIEHVNF